MMSRRTSILLEVTAAAKSVLVTAAPLAMRSLMTSTYPSLTATVRSPSLIPAPFARSSPTSG
jgi:hypothetical protein